jgi:hypothetical protein
LRKTRRVCPYAVPESALICEIRGIREKYEIFACASCLHIFTNSGIWSHHQCHGLSGVEAEECAEEVTALCQRFECVWTGHALYLTSRQQCWLHFTSKLMTVHLVDSFVSSLGRGWRTRLSPRQKARGCVVEAQPMAHVVNLTSVLRDSLLLDVLGTTGLAMRLLDRRR